MNMGELSGMPGYPAPMAALAQPTTGPLRWSQNRVTAAVVAFAAAVVAISGSFVPLFSGSLGFSGTNVEMTFTSWGVDVVGSQFIGDPGLAGAPRYGYPLVFAGVALLCAAAMAAFAAMPTASPGTHRLAGTVTAVGAAFLLGTVWTIATHAVSWVGSFVSLADDQPGVDVVASYEAGHWLLLSAALLALVAAVLSLLPSRKPAARLAAPDESTPPYGIPTGAPVVYALPTVDPLTGQPQSQAAPVDPLTGLPMTPAGQPLPSFPQPMVDPNAGQQDVAPHGQDAVPGVDFDVPLPLADPNTGLPTGQPALPGPGFAVPPPVNPNTGLPAGHPNPAPLVPLIPQGPPDPMVDVPSVVDPNTGLPAGQLHPVSLVPPDPYAVSPPVNPNTGLPSGEPNPAPLIPSGQHAVLPLVDPNTGLPAGQLNPVPLIPDQHAVPPVVDPNTGLPAGQLNPGPLVPSAVTPVNPNTGLPAGEPNPAPLIPPGQHAVLPLVDPNTGLPAGQLSPVPLLVPPAVNPNTGLPAGQPNPAPLVPQTVPDPIVDVPVVTDPYAVPPPVVDPNTGLPAGQRSPAPLVPPPVNPNTGLPAGEPNPAPLIPSGQHAVPPLVDPNTGLPTGQLTPSSLVPPAVDPNTGLPAGESTTAPLVPLARPAPESPQGPAVPPQEDPLAEPGPAR